MSFSEITKLLDKTGIENVLLVCHQNSDPDAAFSAYGLQGLLQKLRPNLKVEIGAASISKLTRNLSRYVPVKINLQPNLERAQVIVLLDTNTIQQLGNLATKVAASAATLILVDHHSPHPVTQTLCELCITREDASSTCDIIYDFYKEQNERPELDKARALFLGMAFDSRHFALAKSATFKAVVDFLDIGVDPQETLSKLALPMEISERIARLKACKRAKIVRINNWVLAFSQVSAYEASGARALVDLGAHVAAVAGKKEEELEISLRCTKEFREKTAIHLGKDIANPLGETLGGTGGGHAMAAGVNAKGEVKTALERCLSLLKENLTKNE